MKRLPIRCRNYNTKKEFETILPKLMTLCEYVVQLTSGPFMPFLLQRKFKHALNRFIIQVSESAATTTSSSPNVSTPKTSLKNKDNSSTNIIESTPNKQDSISLTMKLSNKRKALRKGTDKSSRSHKKKIKVPKMSHADVIKTLNKQKSNVLSENKENLLPTQFDVTDKTVGISKSNIPVSRSSLLSFGDDEPNSDDEYYEKRLLNLKREESKLLVRRAAIDDRQVVIDAQQAAIIAERANIDTQIAMVHNTLSIINFYQQKVKRKMQAVKLLNWNLQDG